MYYVYRPFGSMQERYLLQEKLNSVPTQNPVYKQNSRYYDHNFYKVVNQ